MDLTLRSFYIYAVASGIFSILVVIFAALSHARRRGAEKLQDGGHFTWAQAELEQITAARRPAPRQDDAGLDDTLFRAELLTEARRLIAQVSAERRGGPKVNVEEALAHGLGVTSSGGLRRRLWSHLERLETGSPPPERTSRIKQLRHLVEAGEAPPPFRRAPEPERRGDPLDRG